MTTMNGFEYVEPLLRATWVVDGKVAASPGETDALYIRPMLAQRGAVLAGTRVLHSLILDNNVLTDMVEGRRPANSDYLEWLLRSTPLELNPVMAMVEQRQKFGGASEALREYAEVLGQRFGAWGAKANANIFDSLLEEGKPELAQNFDLLSGYLPAILYIYHQAGTAIAKLEWLSGAIQATDLPFLQLPFYLAALLFLVKEQPVLFRRKTVSKVNKDTKLRSTHDEQKSAVLNLSHDMMLPATAIFPSGLADTVIFPYIATRDYLLQDFLAEIQCNFVTVLPDGRANGAWQLNPTGRIYAKLGIAIDRLLPRREGPGSEMQMAVRRANLRAFSESYIQKCVYLQKSRIAQS